MPKHVYGDEDNRPDAVEPGVYPATIKDAEEKISKSSGNEMIALVWQLENGSLVFDYLTFGDKMAWKVDTFIKSLGIQAVKGEEVDLNVESLRGKRAFLDLSIEHDADGKYPDKNKVARYITDKGQPEPLPF